MASRASHYRAEARHSQRNGVPKAKLKPVGTDTIWVSGWLDEIQGAGPFGVDSVLALPLGSTPRERELKLRQASALGVLQMSALRVAGVFIKYVWELTPSGTRPHQPAPACGPRA